MSRKTLLKTAEILWGFRKSSIQYLLKIPAFISNTVGCPHFCMITISIWGSPLIMIDFCYCAKVTKRGKYATKWKLLMYDHFVSSSLTNRVERGRKLKLAQIRLITRALLLYVLPWTTDTCSLNSQIFEAKIKYRGSPTYTKITNTFSTNTFFGLCTCKWGN